MWASQHTNLVPTLNQRNNVDHSLIIKHHYINTKSSVPVFWIMCLVLKEVYVSGAHDIGPALRRRFVWFDSYIPSTIFQLCRDGSSWVEPVLSYDLCVLLKDTTQWRLWGSNRGPSVSCSFNKPGYEENYPCADPEGAGAPGPAKSQSYRIYLAILVWIHLKISKASQNSMLGH